MEDIGRLSRDIANNDLTSLNAMFTAEKSEPPTLIWAPKSDQVHPATLAKLLDHWHELRGNNEIPLVKDIDPLGFKYALGFVMLLDVLDDGTDFSYRLYGSEITLRYGHDMTGHRTSEFGGYITTFFTAVYRAVLQNRQAIFTVHQPPPGVFVKSWRRLIMPLADDEGNIIRLLVGNVPEDPLYDDG